MRIFLSLVVVLVIGLGSSGCSGGGDLPTLPPPDPNAKPNATNTKTGAAGGALDQKEMTKPLSE
jgi:hypothetical protein